MTVDPAVGTLAPGTDAVFTVNLDRERIMAKGGAGRGSLIVRLDNGDSVPVTVIAEVAGTGFTAAAEAETLAGADGFTTADDAGASGGHYLVFQAAESRKIGSLAVTLPVDIPEAGWYTLCFRVRCPLPVPNHDSLFVGIDDAEPQQSPVSGCTGWSWTNLTTRDGSQVHLGQGRHVIRLLPRESLDLDAVTLRATPIPLEQRGDTLSR